MSRRRDRGARDATCSCGSGRRARHCCARPAPTAAPAASRDIERVHARALEDYIAGRVAAACRALAEVVAERPDSPEAATHYGCALAQLGHTAEAIVQHHRAVRLRPDFPEAHNNLGNALRDYGRPAEALVCFERALALRPGFALAHNNSGNVLRALQRPVEAEAAYRRALALDPEFVDARINLGSLFADHGHTDLGLVELRRALAAAPNSAQAHYNLGNVLRDAGDRAGATTHLEQAVRLAPSLAEGWLNLGNLYKDAGRLEQAVASYRAALTSRPSYASAHSNLLLTLNYMEDVAAETLYRAHREFEALHARGLAGVDRRHANSAQPGRRLRLGYVSPDFRNHAVSYFIEPVLAAHDRQAFEVHCYASVARADAKTAQLRALADAWHDVAPLSDAELASRIEADGIDVLVDLAGHTGGNRLLAFARKPAPVQITWLGYPATTGLSAMDYRLTDAVTEPPGSCEQYYCETLLRLPDALWCYSPQEDMPAVTPLPAQSTGRVVFGSFNNYAKIGPAVVALWARLLHAIPGARLLMISVPTEEARRAATAAFLAHGIGSDRIELRGRLTRSEYLAALAAVDIALDPFPCNGGTTTCDALWMGLPVIALRGDRFLARASYALLRVLDLSWLAAADADGYVALATQLAQDLPALAALRSDLRSRMAGSPLVDGGRFTRALEGLYRDAWRSWCARVTAPAATAEASA